MNEQNLGWASYFDKEFNNENPFVVLSGQVYQLQNNQEFKFDSELPYGVENFMDGNSIKPVNLFDFYEISVFFVARFTDGSNAANVSVWVDDGGSIPLSIETKVLDSTDLSWGRMKFEMPLFAGPNFTVNSGKIMLQSDKDIEIFDIVFTIRLTYNANPNLTVNTPYNWAYKDDEIIVHTLPTYKIAMEKTSPILPVGSYFITWGYSCNVDSVTSDFISKITINGEVLGAIDRHHNEEFKDSTNNLLGSISGTGSAQVKPIMSGFLINLQSPTNLNLKLEIMSEAAGVEVSVWNKFFMIQKVIDL